MSRARPSRRRPERTPSCGATEARRALRQAATCVVRKRTSGSSNARASRSQSVTCCQSAPAELAGSRLNLKAKQPLAPEPGINDNRSQSAGSEPACTARRSSRRTSSNRAWPVPDPHFPRQRPGRGLDPWRHFPRRRRPARPRWPRPCNPRRRRGEAAAVRSKPARGLRGCGNFRPRVRHGGVQNQRDVLGFADDRIRHAREVRRKIRQHPQPAIHAQGFDAGGGLQARGKFEGKATGDRRGGRRPWCRANTIRKWCPPARWWRGRRGSRSVRATRPARRRVRRPWPPPRPPRRRRSPARRTDGRDAFIGMDSTRNATSESIQAARSAIGKRLECGAFTAAFAGADPDEQWKTSARSKAVLKPPHSKTLTRPQSAFNFAKRLGLRAALRVLRALCVSFHSGFFFRMCRP